MKELKDLTFQEVEREIRRLVDANPDNVYAKANLRGCYYSKGMCSDDSEGCLLGQAFSNLGVDVSKWDSEEGYGSKAIAEVLRLGKFNVRPVENIWLIRLQADQDNRDSWSNALSAADEKYPLREEV